MHAIVPLGTLYFRENSQIYLKIEDVRTDHAAADAPGRDATLNQGQRLPTRLRKHNISLRLCLYLYLCLYFLKFVLVFLCVFVFVFQIALLIFLFMGLSYPETKVASCYFVLLRHNVASDHLRDTMYKGCPLS